MPTPQKLSLTLFSFGYKYGFPEQGNFVLDVRCLPNPYWDDTLRPHTGLKKEVAEYVLQSEAGKAMLQQLESFLPLWANQQASIGRKELHIGIGCTGGRHRSVAMIEALVVFLKDKGFAVSHFHRDIEKDESL